MALGNAVGSIICDTGLILGMACLLAPLRLNRAIVNRQGWIQLAAATALVAACFPWSHAAEVWTVGGRLPQFVGFVFLVALAAYMGLSIRWAATGAAEAQDHERSEDRAAGSTAFVLMKLTGALALVVLSAQVLIPSVQEAATRIEIPESIIAATLVAFGTSLPELVTALTAARRGHGELAVGNVVGADILNVLFVAGAAAAVTPAGLMAGSHFFVVLFPAMLMILLIFRVGIFLSGDFMKRPFGVRAVGRLRCVYGAKLSGARRGHRELADMVSGGSKPLLDLRRYGETAREILAASGNGERMMPLTPAGPWEGEALDRLRGSSAEELLDGRIVSREFAECFRSALFLYFSALDESHRISQSIPSTTGSLLHGIMHRREPDFPNAKYWFRRVGRHEIFPALREKALEKLRSARNAPAKRLGAAVESRGDWDPFWFVDQCEKVERGRETEGEQPLMEVQRVEWQLAVEFCRRRAVGEA